ncbi:MAG: uroporphyrinogen-III synthase [Xanthomonadaceae bacterium]|nr:uroporphyrinogen-III synthase [Xanthomonadaceae bacterium]MDP2186527.1 uroporphyrinogen-III synthase [Xanthomonadales bacterium]MDZ4117076.1 uroporphyrinogen-III synthase [Xanthomonadaceae bacterium]MDZ4379273.1 uroporphyrinogen-III synthase [Xanthomonadaceae bacterium]
MSELIRSQPLPADLHGWTILSLRPSGEHAPLRRATARHGARVLALSPLALRPLAAGEALERALNADRIVFSSPAAVRFASTQRALAPCNTRVVVAVGAGTAAALASRGIRAAHPHERMNSEGLLSLPQLQHIETLSVGLITAPGGRGVLAAALADRARQLHVAEVYQRVPRTIGGDAWTKLAHVTTPLAVMVSSGEALDALLRQCPANARATLSRALIVAASQRLDKHVRLAGFKHIIRAASARPSNMLQALAEFHGESRFR